MITSRDGTTIRRLDLLRTHKLLLLRRAGSSCLVGLWHSKTPMVAALRNLAFAAFQRLHQAAYVALVWGTPND
jgi:hypothetical protein